MGDLTKPVFRTVPGGVEVEVWVQPGAVRSEIVGFHGEALKIRVAAQAREGRANQALVEFLANVFGLPRSRISIVHGERTRKKTVFIQGLTLEEARRRLL